MRSTIDLSHNLGLDVVAEGVENAETLGRLADLGCDRAQGYHISRPLTPESLVAWLADPSNRQAVEHRPDVSGRRWRAI